MTLLTVRHDLSLCRATEAASMTAVETVFNTPDLLQRLLELLSAADLCSACSVRRFWRDEEQRNDNVLWTNLAGQNGFLGGLTRSLNISAKRTDGREKMITSSISGTRARGFRATRSDQSSACCTQSSSGAGSSIQC